MKAIIAFALCAFATGARAETCMYVDDLGDKATYDLTADTLDIAWVEYLSGKPTTTEHCLTRPVGVEMLQTDAVCPGTKTSHWFSVGPSRKGGKTLDIMAMDGLIWWGTCKK